MINPRSFLSELTRRGVDFFCGVPDSLLKDFLNVLPQGPEHVICANEGAAIAVSVGHHLASGRVPLVYMQNSGLGNAVNPLLSLADAGVYSIPLCLLIGWRGEPQVHDEPQHRAMGQATLGMLNQMQIQTEIIGPASNLNGVLDKLFGGSDKAVCAKPVALLVRKNSFEQTLAEHASESNREFPSRAQVLEALLSKIDGSNVIVATTGFTSRELYALRERARSTACDFLNVGAMGHASSISLGLAVSAPTRQVICIDGDGSAIMHMGALAIIGQKQPVNLKHIILNNRCHESVGGQPTAGLSTNFAETARACNYGWVKRAGSALDLAAGLESFLAAPGPALLEVLINPGSLDDLPRPAENFKERKELFMKQLPTP